MKKAFKILFMLMLMANIGFGQELSVKLSYNKLKEVCKQLGDKNAIAFYAIKQGTKTTLTYAIYDPKTMEVSYYNGKPISNENFKKLISNVKLNNNIIFSGNIGATGIERQTKDYFVITALNTIMYKPSLKTEKQKRSYSFIFYNKDNILKWKIVDKNGVLLQGGGSGGEPNVTKAPKDSNP